MTDRIPFGPWAGGLVWQMPENDVPSDTQATPNVTPVTPKRTPGYRSAITARPEARLNGNGPVGRRIRDLFRALMERLNNPTDVIVVADVLAWAELKAAAEIDRARLLKGETKDNNAVVRGENLVKRAAARLGLEPAGPPAPETLDELFARVAAEQAEAAEATEETDE